MSMFKEGRTNVKNEPCPGRPISATSGKDISTFKAVIDGLRYTVEEISDILGLSVFSILKEKLRAVWNRHLLTSIKKRKQVDDLYPRP
jgi:hypothetical protein